MRIQYYVNLMTGEVTENHRQAVEWYRAGDEVDIYLNGRQACTWVH